MAGAKKKNSEIPVILNKNDKGNLSFSSKRRDKPKVEEKLDSFFEDKRKTYFAKNAEKRVKSSHQKSKIYTTLQFQTNLEPEFLNLFAKGEEFNFY